MAFVSPVAFTRRVILSKSWFVLALGLELLRSERQPLALFGERTDGGVRAFQLLTRLTQREFRFFLGPFLDELLPGAGELVEVRDAPRRTIQPSLQQVSPSVVTEELAVVGLDLALDRQTPCLTVGLLSQSDDGRLLDLGARRCLRQRLQA
jgi:hypothetical protein